MQKILYFLRGQKRFMIAAVGLLLLHAMLRAFFIGHNQSFFSAVDFKEGVNIFLRGLQQDYISLLFINLPLFLSVFIRGLFKPALYGFGVDRMLFCFLNGFGLALNIIDIGYYSFGKHRSSLELWYFFWDSRHSFGSIALRFWMLIGLFFLCVFFLYKLGRYVYPIRREEKTRRPKLVYLTLTFLVLLLVGRGFESRPVLPYTPLLNVQSSHLAAAQNSVYTLLYSLWRKQTQIVSYSFFSDMELDRLMPVVHPMGKPGEKPTRQNVVIFILESFARSHLQPGHPLKASTPFFDSLIVKSLNFPNAYANNFTSAHGIVSILGSVPSYLYEPFFHSPYANLQIQGIGNALKGEGYNTQFFMGAEPDHFGFGKFSKMVGIDRYYSKKDFGNNQLDDGNWGIWDEPFFQYGNKVLSRKNEPFLAVFYNLSSHHPFSVPAAYEEKLKGRNALPSQKSISYVDAAMQAFFYEAKRQPWFKNTLFVFCADHWFAPTSNIIVNPVNSAAIPFFIYDPSKPQGAINYSMASQLDLVPTVLDLLNYTNVYKGFGRSLLDSMAPKYAYYRYQNHYYQAVSKDLVLGYDPIAESTSYLYLHRNDSIVSENLVRKEEYRTIRQEMEKYTKAHLQRYNKVLLERKF